MTAMDENELRALIVAEYRATRRRRYQAQCQGKHQFESSASAFRGMRQSGMVSFKCKFCGTWHVAMKPRKEGKNRA